VLHVPAAQPAGVDADRPWPLVVDLHGYSEPVAVHVLQSALAAYGETAGFVTVAPGIERPVPRWDSNVGSGDVGFLAELLDHIGATVCVDTNRIYVAGLSNGAFMTSVIACDLSDRVAAVAPVAGIQAPAGCAPARPVPVISFHGTADTFVPYTGGLGSSVAALPSADGSGTLGTAAVSVASDSPTVEDRTSSWAQRNGCQAAPVEEVVAADVALLRFDCPIGDEVLLYRVDGGGHSWPGSAFSKTIESIVGPTTDSIDATELMWEFFQDHPLGG
jgi:polyhydroxybutyrate depolymerase